MGGFTCPFFLRGPRAADPAAGQAGAAAGARHRTEHLQPVIVTELPAVAPWAPAIERTVTGLGYELVEVERAPRGLLRVTIDRVPGHAVPAAAPAQASADEAAGPTPPSATASGVTVDDCERVTRQLQYVLELDGVPYERLEVSSPGLDRPLRRAQDYERFSGEQVELTLRAPLQGRKRFKGVLGRGDDAGRWRLVFDDGRGEQVLEFGLDEVREARLVPVLDFKGRGRAAGDAEPARRGPGSKPGDDGVGRPGNKKGKGGARGATADGGGQR